MFPFILKTLTISEENKYSSVWVFLQEGSIAVWEENKEKGNKKKVGMSQKVFATDRGRVEVVRTEQQRSVITFLALAPFTPHLDSRNHRIWKGNWKGPIRVIESNSFLFTGLPKTKP